MKKQKSPKESVKSKIDVKALKKLLKKINLKSSVVGVIGLVLLVGLLSSIKNYTDTSIKPSGAYPIQPDTVEPIEPPDIYHIWDVIEHFCPVACQWDRGETPIVCFNHIQHNPAIYEDIVVWADHRDSDFVEYSIYIKDLSDPAYPRWGKKLTSNYRGEDVPDIYQKKIVWEDYRNGQLNADIYMYDLDATGQPETQITSAIKAQSNPQIYGDYIVWEDYRDDPDPRWNIVADIYVYDLVHGGDAIRITNTPDISEVKPQIWNNIIAFRSIDIIAQTYLPIITLYDLSSGASVVISIDGDHASSPTIDENKVVWIESFDGATRIDTMYVATFTIFDGAMTISQKNALPLDASAYKNNPKMQGNKIVWEDSHRSGSEGTEIFLYDLANGLEERITYAPGAQYQPVVYGNKIVWTDMRNGFPSTPACPPFPFQVSDIYMRELP